MENNNSTKTDPTRNKIFYIRKFTLKSCKTRYLAALPVRIIYFDNRFFLGTPPPLRYCSALAVDLHGVASHFFSVGGKPSWLPQLPKVLGHFLTLLPTNLQTFVNAGSRHQTDLGLHWLPNDCCRTALGDVVVGGGGGVGWKHAVSWPWRFLMATHGI